MGVQQVLVWAIFLAFVLGMIFFDLLVLHRKAHAINLREAAIGVAVPVTVALAFTGFIYYAYQNHLFGLGDASLIAQTVKPESLGFWPTDGAKAATMYLTGYIVEISLSADNVFLFVVLMNFFKVPAQFQHRVLFWGVLGALIMRGVMIGLGAALISQFNWIIYIFGAFLLFTGLKMLFSGDDADANPSDNIAVRMTKRVVPISDHYHGQSFFIMEAGRRIATPLLLVLVCIEFTDLVFAVDSIPAIFGITQDPFIVFTSNVFAILGLRSMYFLLAGVMDKFHYLKVGLSLVLLFVGVKMILPAIGGWLDKDQSIERKLSWLFELDPQAHHHWHIRIGISLGFIVLTLAGSIIFSLLFPQKHHIHNPLENTDPDAPPPTP